MLALLAIATFAAAVVAGLGTSVAFAGESTGNCGATDTVDPFKGSANAADNCKGGAAEEGTRVSNGNSWCSYSGQNDVPAGSDEEGPGGRTQNWGHTSQPGTAVDPSNPETKDTLSPGVACNKNRVDGFPGPETPPRK